MTLATRIFRAATIPTIVGTIGGVIMFGSLGHRFDYVGHYAAGFGATLILLAGAQLAAPARTGSIVIMLISLVSIGFGAIAEETVFKLAQFDPVDFVNQSLGAVLAGIVVIAARAQGEAGGQSRSADSTSAHEPTRPGDPMLAAFVWIVIGGAAVVAGFRFAFALIR